MAEESEREMPLRARAARIAALVLAAGRSSRMEGQHKLVYEIDGVPLVRLAVEAALGSRCVQTLVVSGHGAEAVEAAIGDRPVSLVENPRPEDGMAASLRLGLRSLARDIDGVVVLLADMPRITAAHVDRLVAAFDPASPAIVAPERGGRRGNPVLWPQRHFAEMMALSGDQGARSLLVRHAADLVLVPIDDEAIFVDIDTAADLDRLARP